MATQYPSGTAPAERRGLFRRLFDTVDAMRRAFVNLLFLLFLVIVLVAIFGGPSAPHVPDGAALDVEISGVLVERRSPAEAIAAVLGEGIADETVLHDVVDGIDAAAKDERIRAIVLRLDRMTGADLAKLNAIGAALQRFKAAGKKVYAQGDSYTQEQYFLASFGDRVLMHPMGDVGLAGFSAYDLFMRDALERLSVHMNVFRVGQYKAAVEPFLRDDMSPEARAANTALIDSQWGTMRNRIAANRKLAPAAVDAYTAGLAQQARARRGDLARVALEARLVDELLDRDAMRKRVNGLLLAQRPSDAAPNDADDPPRITLHDYRQAMAPADSVGGDRIGVITVRGTITVDDPRGGDAGAKQIVELLERAREDDDVKAVVLRVDSPGGSAFASELIRAEVELTQNAGKPVVVSMSGLAASGGYWIAATADEIWADPGTITGSIGIFGVVPTFEKTLAEVGVRADGVATSPLTGAAVPFAALTPEIGEIVQSSVEHGYRQFVHLVARGRDLPPAKVEEIAQGRVWTGADAKRLGLVDGLGGLESALAAAAKRAKLEAYGVERIEPVPNARQAFLLNLAEQLGFAAQVRERGTLRSIVDDLLGQAEMLARLDDPRHVYALCSACTLR